MNPLDEFMNVITFFYDKVIEYWWVILLGVGLLALIVFLYITRLPIPIYGPIR